GVETSEPYTDLRLIEFMLATPPQDQIYPGQRKFLLWAAMDGLLPEPVRQRKEKGRIARILFQGITHSRDALRDMVLQTPELLSPYINAEALATALDRVAWGDTVHQAAFLSALALVFWVHRLPWAGGRLLCEP
ncbi:MAG: asparagine synthase-related protein, partial [Ktedonobacteraceae bacterium]